MISISTAEIEAIRDFLELTSLEVNLRSLWGSEFANHQDEIHGELKKRMARAYPFSDSSISHCRTLGGFAFTEFDSEHIARIGFDVEEDDRVTEAVARRVCKSDHEFQSAPSAASLWAAKEAAFKSLKGQTQPKTVSQVELSHWQKLDSHIETALVTAPEFYSCSRIKGVVLKKSPFTLAFFAALS